MLAERGSSRRQNLGVGVGWVAAVALAGSLSACGGAPEKVAFENKVFYQYDTLNPAQAAKSLEAHYPPLDQSESPPLPEYTGVSVLGDAVHISRPRDWVIRAGSIEAEHRYIEYVSPNEYMVAVYELAESPLDVWLEGMGRYEEQAKKSGAELLGQRVPMATANTQGRGYFVRRPVAAAKGPLLNYSNEYILRGDRRIGTVTSGNFSPVLERGIALALIDTAAGIGDQDAVDLDVRGRHLGAQLTTLPFVHAGQRAGQVGGGR